MSVFHPPPRPSYFSFPVLPLTHEDILVPRFSNLLQKALCGLCPSSVCPSSCSGSLTVPSPQPPTCLSQTTAVSSSCVTNGDCGTCGEHPAVAPVEPSDPGADAWPGLEAWCLFLCMFLLWCLFYTEGQRGLPCLMSFGFSSVFKTQAL